MIAWSEKEHQHPSENGVYIKYRRVFFQHVCRKTTPPVFFEDSVMIDRNRIQSFAALQRCLLLLSTQILHASSSDKATLTLAPSSFQIKLGRLLPLKSLSDYHKSEQVTNKSVKLQVTDKAVLFMQKLVRCCVKRSIHFNTLSILHFIAHTCVFILIRNACKEKQNEIFRRLFDTSISLYDLCQSTAENIFYQPVIGGTFN